uniref:Vitelline membrane cysteine-rich region protein n=1 Tax=Siphoviridae sp. ct43U4 TaxID=2826285 RepID=A0A8S5MZP1_9CAUD|nr:MAG TPA: vitelline membrane cysteine-rich region protein [Siphoviridae sp. ct43U4]
MRYLYYLYYVQLCPKNYAFSLLNRYFVICLGHSSFQTFLTP